MVFLFLVTQCLVVAVQLCIEWISIKKRSIFQIFTIDYKVYCCLFFWFFCSTLLLPLLYHCILWHYLLYLFMLKSICHIHFILYGNSIPYRFINSSVHWSKFSNIVFPWISPIINVIQKYIKALTPTFKK